MSLVSGMMKAAGLLRSLLTYYAIPGRIHSKENFYRNVVAPGDLCIDGGAHVGNHTRALLAAGASVLMVEPDPLFRRLLHLLYGGHERAVLIPAALGAQCGSAQLLISYRTPTTNTLSADWMNEPGADRWDASAEVTVTTLDTLIDTYGAPAFCKLDIEGYELQALRGLSTPIPFIAVEYLPSAVEQTIACIHRLLALGDYEFNWTVAERMRLVEDRWVDADTIIRRLSGLTTDDRFGDVYARLLD